MLMERAHLERAAVRHSRLRDLLLVPADLLCIVAALANEQILSVWSVPAAVAVAAAVCLAIARHYRARYGSVSPSGRQEARELAAVAAAIVLIIGGALLLRDLPVNPVAVAFALGMVVGYATGPGLETHHQVIWGALLVAGAVPVWDGADSSNAGLILAGVAVIANGLLDHRAFLHTFGPPGDARA
jgi:hypothetical protein